MNLNPVASARLALDEGQRVVISLEVLEGLTSPDQDPSTAGLNQGCKFFHIGNKIKF